VHTVALQQPVDDLRDALLHLPRPPRLGGLEILGRARRQRLLEQADE